MAIRLLDDHERRRRSRAIQAVHAQWAAEQIAEGVDGPVPPGRVSPSDYNQHVPDLEAPPGDVDTFWRRVTEATA